MTEEMNEHVVGGDHTLNIVGKKIDAIWCPPEPDGSMVGLTTIKGCDPEYLAKKITVRLLMGPNGLYAIAHGIMADGRQEIIPLHLASTISFVKGETL